MFRMVTRRLVQLPIILWVVATLTLALAWGVPGNPLERPEGRRPAPEVAAAMARQYRLDSFWSFYASYLRDASGLGYVAEHLGPAPHAPRPVFDLGPSLQYRDKRVNDIIADALPVSMTLGAAAIFIALAMGIPAGVIGATRPGSAVDHATTLLVLLGVSVPSFVVGSVLLLVFSLWLRWFPVGSWGSMRDLALPAFTLALPIAAYIARLTRLGMIDALASDYIRTARAKGLGNFAIVWRHALKNACLPVLSYLGPAAAGAMTGSFVVESVFSVPGLGQHFVNAVQNKDLFLIMGVVLVFATMLVVFNLIVDVLHRWVDPRVT